MRSKTLLSILLSSSILLSNNLHDQLILPSVDIDNPFWEFFYQPIAQREEDSLAQLVEKWNSKLPIIWKKINQKIKSDIGITTDQIDNYFTEKRFVDAYVMQYQRSAPHLISTSETQETSSDIINFIHDKVTYIAQDFPISILFKDDIKTLAMTLGSNSFGHSLLVNTNIYSSETIQYMYECTAKKEPLFYSQPHTNFHQSSIIEFTNLLHFGITQAMADAFHEHDLFIKLLRIFTYNKKPLEQENIAYCSYYIYFLSFLEACLQSKNPLEAAIFLEPQMDNFHQDFIFLWQEFIEDIKNCYNEDDLNNYLTTSKEIRQSSLFTDND